MRKAMRALTVLSLFGLGLGSVTSCGPAEKSISLTVDGKAVENGSSVTVNQAVPFTLKATLANGSEEDQIVWRTNAASAFTFSAQVGEEITVTPNTATTTGYTISASLQGDNTVTTAINVIVTAGETKYSLDVDTSDMKTEYVQGDFFSTEGMEVYGVESINGQEINRYELGATEYTIDLTNGTRLEEVGTITVHVNPVDQTYAAGSFDISVVENRAWGFVNFMQDLADNGYMGLYSDDSGYVYTSNFVTDDFYFDLRTGMYYRNETSGVRQYEIGGEEALEVRDAGNVYKNYKNQTDLKDFIKTATNATSSLDEWLPEYSTGIEVYTNSGYEFYVLNSDASNFLASIYGYDSLSLDGVNILPVSAEVTFIDDANSVAQIIFFVSVQGQQLMAGTEFLGTLDQETRAEIAEIDSIITAKDPSNFTAYDSAYTNPLFQAAVEGIGGAQTVAYTTTSKSTYIVTPTSVEARFFDLESGAYNVFGHGILDSDYTFTDDYGEVHNLTSGALRYEITANPTTGEATAFNIGVESDPDITSTDDFGYRWTDMPLLSKDFWKYYTFDSLESLPVYDDDGKNIIEYTDTYTFGIHGSDIEFTESLNAIDYAFQYNIEQSGLTPFKVEVSLVAHFDPDNLKAPSGVSAEITYWATDSRDGRLYYILRAESDASIEQTYWDTNVFPVLDKVGETTEPAA